MKTPVITLLIGPSGGGKSTLAREMMLKNPNARVVGRDKLRETVFGYTEDTIHKYYTDHNLAETEKEISAIQNSVIKSLIKQGKDVLVDNTFLRLSYINRFIKDFNYCVIKFILVEADYDVCIARDKARKRSVGEDVIKKQFGELKTLKQNFDFKTYAPTTEQILQDESLPHCVTYDLDGTMALHLSGRGPFDYHRLLEDTLCKPVHASYEAYKAAGYKIIICTGREGLPEVVENSKLWLFNHGILYDEFHIRTAGDQRPDYIVKDELWRDIASRYYIVALYDDRDQVVSAGRRLGLTVYQVAEGDF